MSPGDASEPSVEPEGRTRGWDGLTPLDLLLCAALAYFVVVGGTELGSFLPFRVLNTIIGAAFVAVWLRQLPKRADRTDLLVVGALVLFLVACMLSAFPRMSFGAATDALAYTAVFGVARWELRRPVAARAMVVVLAVSSVCITLVIVSVWGDVWRDWLVQLGTLPPLDVRLPVGPYRHPHAVAMLAALLAPALLLAFRERRLWILGAAGVPIAAAVILMAGGRGVWVAIGVVVAGALLIQRIRSRRVIVGLAAGLALGAIAAALIPGLIGNLVDRLATTSTLSLRFDYWQEAMDQWARKPLAGWGPGSFGAFMTLDGYFDAQPYLPRHADNAVVQLMGEAGLLGLASLAALAATMVLGIRRAGSASSVWGIYGVALFCLLSMTDNPSDTPNLVVVGIVWAALAAPATTQAEERPRQPSARALNIVRGLSVGSAVVVGAAVASTLVAAAAFDQARASAAGGDTATTRELIRTSVAFDPSMAIYLRSLGVAELAEGNPERAESDLARAAGLNPADATALRSLAVARAELGDETGAITAAEAAVEARRADPANLLMLAHLAAEYGQTDLARGRFVEALAYGPWLPGSEAWDDEAMPPDALPDALLDALPISDELAAEASASDFARTWLAALTGERPAPADPMLAALHAVLRCELEAADTALRTDPAISTHSDGGVVTTLLVARLLEDDALREQGMTVADLRLAGQGAVLAGGEPGSPFEDRGEDLRLYGMTAPDAPPSSILLPTTGDAIAAWLASPAEAARENAPGSAIDGCHRP